MHMHACAAASVYLLSRWHTCVHHQLSAAAAAAAAYMQAYGHKQSACIIVTIHASQNHDQDPALHASFVTACTLSLLHVIMVG